MALTIAGDLCFNPLKDRLLTHEGKKVKFSEPVGDELPVYGFTSAASGYLAPVGTEVEIRVDPQSKAFAIVGSFPGMGWKRLIEYAFADQDTREVYY